jgi:hypothetical protein
MSIKKTFLLGLVVIIYACGPKTIPVSTEEDYHEDLSSTLPDIDKYKSPVANKTRPEKTEFREPYMDITTQLDQVLDTLAKVNKDIPYFKYTILVHNSNSRQAADEARKNVFRVLPEADPVMQFISPSYRVKVGSYFDKIEAYPTLVKLKELFPNAVIVPEQVFFK